MASERKSKCKQTNKHKKQMKEFRKQDGGQRGMGVVEEESEVFLVRNEKEKEGNLNKNPSRPLLHGALRGTQRCQRPGPMGRVLWPPRARSTVSPAPCPPSGSWLLPLERESRVAPSPVSTWRASGKPGFPEPRLRHSPSDLQCPRGPGSRSPTKATRHPQPRHPPTHLPG